MGVPAPERWPPAGGFERVCEFGWRAIRGLLIALLAIMVVLVFGNVVLRYGFDSGITVSEELSRLLFLWVTFLGAVPVLRANGHLGVDTLLHRLGPSGRRVAVLASHVLVLGCCLLFAWGAWQQVLLNRANALPVSGVPTAWAYGAAVISGLGMALLIVADIARLGRGGAPALGPPEGERRES